MAADLGSVNLLKKKTTIFPINAASESYNINSFINCDTSHVVYIIQCREWNLCNIGCTIRKIKLRIAEHFSAIDKHHIHHSGETSHFIQAHEGNVISFSYYAIEHVAKPTRGGDWRKVLLVREAYWILRLGTRIPHGLNLNDLFLLYLVRANKGSFIRSVKAMSS